MGERRYEIHLRGTVPAERLSEVLEDFPGTEVSTVLRGRVADQSELFGLLLRLHGLGLAVIALQSRAVPPAPTALEVSWAGPGAGDD